MSDWLPDQVRHSLVFQFMTISLAGARRHMRPQTGAHGELDPTSRPVPRTSLCAAPPGYCPRQVLGIQMGLLPANPLGLDLPPDAKHALAIVETDGCFADGVSVATG